MLLNGALRGSILRIVSVRSSSDIISYAQKGFCSGCGVCAGICPKSCLEMRFNAIGEYLPNMVSEECNQCGLCRKVCPFVDENPDEDEHGKARYAAEGGVHHCSETGYYHKNFVGFAPNKDIRWAGASGGMLTWSLCELLRRKKIDHVICVHQNSDPEKLYKFNVVSTEEEILSGSKSSYYPVELSEVVRHMLDVPGRYAVVGLPCVCKAIRNAQKTIPKLDHRIEYLFGLVCVGQQANTNYSKAIAQIAGLEGELVGIRFREKKKESPLPNMLFSVRGSNGECVYASFFGGVKTLWASGAFRLSGCNYCDDAFAECADAAFMDAWLPEYEEDSIGYNIVLSRKAGLSKLLEEVNTLAPISIEKVISSQAVYAKRTLLSSRLFIGRCLGHFAPRKRVSSQIPSLKVFVKTILQCNQYKAARKNLKAGKTYNALRVETLPFVAIQKMGGWGGRIIRNINK